jgi:signal transduction histidine kinase
MIDQQERLRGLVEAGIALTSELSLDAVLRRLVETAASLTGARYAALGVIDRSGTGLERFIPVGVSDDVVEEIGELPVGRGILGVLIREAKPLRLRDLHDDPRSVGFPPGHPPMRTFLGVPILLRGVAYGNLYLTEKEGGQEFADKDEEVVALLAAQAAVAIENARLYESATKWLRQLETMTEVGNALAGELELPRLLRLIAGRLQELVGARLVLIALPTPDGDLRIEASAGHDQVGELVGVRLSRQGTKTGRVLERGQGERVDSLVDDPEVDHTVARRFASLTGLPVPSTGMFLPLIVRGRTIGVIAIHDKIAPDQPADLRFSGEDMRLAETFAARAAVAVDLSQRVERDVLRRVVAAQELERKRLARELHDETGQALTSILLGLRTVEETGSEDARRAALASLREMAVATLQDVRRLAVELRPKALDDFGLVPAIQRLTEGFREQTAIQIDFEARLADRLPGELETSLYRIVQEALTNVVKHARARHVSVLLTRKDSRVAVVIEDDGRGFAPELATDEGLGLIGMRERLALLDGVLTVESSPGAGTTLVAEVPIWPLFPTEEPSP